MNSIPPHEPQCRIPHNVSSFQLRTNQYAILQIDSSWGGHVQQEPDPSIHQQNNQSAVGCYGDPQHISPTDIPLSPTACSQQPSTHSQHHRTSVKYYYCHTGLYLNLWPAFDWKIILLLTKCSNNNMDKSSNMCEIWEFGKCVSDNIPLALRAKEKQVFSQVMSPVICIRSSFLSHQMASTVCNKCSIWGTVIWKSKSKYMRIEIRTLTRVGTTVVLGSVPLSQ